MLRAPMKFVTGNEIVAIISAAAVDGVAIPTMQNGKRPKYVAVSHDGGGLQRWARIGFGDSTVAIAAVSGFMVPSHEVVLFDVTGFTHFAWIAAGSVSITIVPLENF